MHASFNLHVFNIKWKKKQHFPLSFSLPRSIARSLGVGIHHFNCISPTRFTIFVKMLYKYFIFPFIYHAHCSCNILMKHFSAFFEFIQIVEQMSVLAESIRLSRMAFASCNFYSNILMQCVTIKTFDFNINIIRRISNIHSFARSNKNAYKCLHWIHILFINIVCKSNENAIETEILKKKVMIHEWIDGRQQ